MSLLPAPVADPARRFRLRLRLGIANAVRRFRRAAAPTNALARRIRAQQIDLLFKNVGPGVVGACFAAVVLAFVLSSLNALSEPKGLLWTLYILVCMSAHLALLYFYKTSKFDAINWRPWAAAFTVICFFEGAGWGWAPVFLDDSGRMDIRILIACSTVTVATGAVAAFGSYLPAFFALFVPASLPFAIDTIFEPNPAMRGLAFLMPVYIATITVMVIQVSGKFKELVELRLKSGELAEDLRIQVELAEQSMIAKANFLAAASHDLRQPVHAISLFAGALRDLPLPEAARRLTGQIENSVVALDGLFAAVLDISRLDARSVEVRKTPLAIQALIARVCQDFSAEAATKSVRVDWVPCRAWVYTDAILLERILRNLVSNAVRYTPHGRVLVGCRRRGAQIEVQVCDTGLGIAREHREVIFKEYFQLHNPERDRQKGLGLGLAIVRRLANLLGCELLLQSEVGRGSCFKLCVPLADAEAPQAPVEASAFAFGGEGRLIVVVDDEAAILTGMSTLLEGWGYVVVAGGSGADVVAKLAQCPQRPDLVISDHWLRAGETGFDVIDTLRAEYNLDIPAILISGDTGPKLRAQAQAIGAVLIYKPTPNGKLRAAIAHSVIVASLE
jgi:signal transduction histidine kinase/CheY-like chemotaxis protein